MKLLIVSDMPHYVTPHGQVLGWGPTVQEIDHLASLFSEVKHIGFLHQGEIPKSMLPYQSNKICFIPVKPTGGAGPSDKLGVLAQAPVYIKTVLHHLRQADVLHIRCPSNIGLMFVVFLAFLSHPKYRWVKYAGNWKPTEPESLSYTFQRWWLNQGFHRGTVTVNGQWNNQPKYVYSFLNPSLTNSELELAQQIAVNKVLTQPVELLFVGRAETAKGCGRLLSIAKNLMERQVTFNLRIIGDGPERSHFEQQVKNMGLEEKVTFYGWLPHHGLAQFYSRAHFMLLPTSASEGWPKVLSEAMAYGAIPLAGSVSSIPQILNRFGVGLALPPNDIKSFTDALHTYITTPQRWLTESRQGAQAAKYFTYDSYLQSVQAMMKTAWDL